VSVLVEVRAELLVGFDLKHVQILRRGGCACGLGQGSGYPCRRGRLQG
jgi:hypothetical protein